MRKTLRRLWQEDEGQDLVEYGLLIVLVALASIAAMSSVADAVNEVLYSKAVNALTNPS
ncbi:MAG: Flp family type IVb pilin [Terriglobia bacterium]